MHGLLGLRAQQIADAGLEVADGLLAIALGHHVLVDVPEAVRPSLKLYLMRYICSFALKDCIRNLLKLVQIGITHGSIKIYPSERYSNCIETYRSERS